MPKDPAKNVDRYKIRGGMINEYEYHENQGDTKVSEPQKGTKSSRKNTTRGATAKKLAARKAAKKYV